MKELLDTIKNWCEDRNQLVLSSDTNSLSFQTRIVKVLGEREVLIFNSIPLSELRQTIKSQKFFLAGEQSVLLTSKLEPQGVNIKFFIEDVTSWSAKRIEKRVSVDSSKQRMVFLNPIDKTTVIKKRVIDISKGGASIKLKRENSLWEVGRVLTDLRFDSWEDDVVSSGKIIYKKPVVSLQGEKFYQIGIQFLKN